LPPPTHNEPKQASDTTGWLLKPERWDEHAQEEQKFQDAEKNRLFQ
jgi:hypothetical protein